MSNKIEILREIVKHLNYIIKKISELADIIYKEEVSDLK